MKVALSAVFVACLSALQVSAQVKGTAFGFATGTVGGGNAKPQTPTSPAQLKQWLEDDVARVIMLDREYNFKGSDGTCTNCAGCIPTSYKCGNKAQLAIAVPGQTWCDSLPKTKVTYDKAALTPIQVKSNKSIVGVGSKGIIRGKGLRMANGVKQVIIQNVHITDLNPQYIWGGDAITLAGTDKIWVDHSKTSLIGRQHFVTGFSSSGGVTVSNHEFDGKTSWSSSCDGHHYWAILGYGKGDQITFANNYVHDTSGRSPKLEYNSVWHVYNNYWSNNSGHAFDVGEGAQAFIEGNVFENVKKTVEPNKAPGSIFAPTSANVGTCKSYLGRNCQPNIYSGGSPAIVGTQSGFLANFKNYKAPAAQSASSVKSQVVAHAGVGKI
ncbi:uncharacterized protein PFL1_00473 [Pseudozyma flocculosa PF-1]|uniref:pectin lyase n=1 Tax=Pseudozyma flocculosa TaxID=84751 RepID=A0A5C3EUK1_9BASI|nr:uncharacterized protein PFL1_00473 [Pseudozyma flocculosa PF-1]EPQ32276.1 hypothetical protein PFL1_00473 [Pseudozyma flocculosa PF-1]SPO34769.1 related to Probable pectin lyase F [Pseudozyma flocculosa]